MTQGPVPDAARRAYWDAALDNQAAVPGTHALFEEWPERSRRLRARPEAKLNYRFAPAPRACFDGLPAYRPGRRPSRSLQHDINVVVPAAHHYSVLEALARPDGPLLARILDFLGR